MLKPVLHRDNMHIGDRLDPDGLPKSNNWFIVNRPLCICRLLASRDLPSQRVLATDNHPVFAGLHGMFDDTGNGGIAPCMGSHKTPIDPNIGPIVSRAKRQQNLFGVPIGLGKCLFKPNHFRR